MSEQIKAQDGRADVWLSESLQDRLDRCRKTLRAHHALTEREDSRVTRRIAKRTEQFPYPPERATEGEQENGQ